MARVQVAVPLPVYGTFTYETPQPLEVGVPVVVPFGSRQVNGWVIGEGSPPIQGIVLKPLERILSEDPDFDAQQLQFFEWIASYYLSPLGEVIATAVPAATSARTRHVYLPTETGIEALARQALGLRHAGGAATRTPGPPGVSLCSL